MKQIINLQLAIEIKNQLANYLFNILANELPN
jgi:hypothetical protein